MHALIAQTILQPVPSPSASSLIQIVQHGKAGAEGHALPDFGILGALDALSTRLGGIVALFIIVYLLIILVRLLTGDEVEFLGLFKTSRRLREARRSIAELTQLLRGRGILFTTIESSLERSSLMGANVVPTTRDEALRYLCEWIPRGLNFGGSGDASKIVVFVPDGQERLVVRSHNGLSPESVAKMVFPIVPSTAEDDTFAAMAFRYGEIVVSGNVDADPRYHNFHGNRPTHPYKSLLAVPIRNGEEVIAVFTIDSVLEDQFADEDVQFAVLFSWLFADYLTEDRAAGPGVERPTGM